MIDVIELWLADANKTALSGRSLASSMYSSPVDILLTGPLGAGKTSFLQGFMHGLGIEGPVTSPTYALEQRYRAKNGLEVLHLDLYRLTEAHARELLLSTETHEGIRCIEWADKIDGAWMGHAPIRVELSEQDAGRSARVTFEDILLPTDEDVARWRAEVRLPANIIAHCDAVADVATRVSQYFVERGMIVRTKATHVSALLHDLVRFIDFKEGGSTERFDEPRDVELWNEIRDRYHGMGHEQAGAEFLRERGYGAVASIVETHGVKLPPVGHATVEQMIVFYADKRCAGDTIVTLEERFDDFDRRYGVHPKHDEWKAEARRVEQALFPDGVPF